MSDERNNPFTESAAFQEMKECWRATHALRDGKKGVLDERGHWLAQAEGESDKAYNIRIRLTHVFNATDDTISKVVAKPFQEKVQLEGDEDFPPQLKAIETNADGEGTSLTDFAASLFDDAATHGLTHCRVDNPSNPERRGRAGHPYFARVSPRHTPGWRFSDEGGEKHLTQIRFREDGMIEDGEFGEKKVDRVRVWYPDRWELHERRENQEKPVKIAGDVHTFKENGVARIPIDTAYFNRTGFMTGRSPFEELADENIAHVQLRSRQYTSLDFANMGILFGAGFKKADNEEIELGPIKFITNKDTASSLSAVEFTASALKELAAEIVRVEHRMETLGHQAIIRPGNETATGVRSDEAKSEAAIHQWVRSIAALIRRAYVMAGLWIGYTVPDTFKVKLFTDFSLSMRASLDLQELRADFDNGAIDHRTYLEHRERYGLYREGLDIDKVIAQVSAEAPSKLGIPDPPRGKPDVPPEPNVDPEAEAA